jgi:replicative DNA helicase
MQPERAASRLHPHSVEAEQAVLGALLLDGRAWHTIADTVRANDFYRAEHRLIFEAIAEVAGRNQPCDAVTLSDHLERKGKLEQAGGLAYLGALARDTASAANVEAYAKLVRDRATMRRLQDVAARISRSITEAGDRDAAELIADAQEALFALRSDSRRGSGLVGAGELVRALIDDLDTRKTEARGLAVGLSDFDELTGGVEPGDLAVIAGRPGMGKTALLVSIGAHVSKSGPVATFSAEMPSAQLTRRCVALLSQIPQGKFRRVERLSDSDWAAIWAAASDLAGRRLHVDDTAAPTLAHVRAECTALRVRHGLALVLVDYVQLMRGAGANRYEQLRDVAYGLKAMAKDLAVPVIALAQLNRGVESRERKRPGLSDLRDSGAIEEAADIVGLLYSEGYYNRAFTMGDVLECAIDKNRNGERGECLWRFSGAHSHVEVLDDGARAQYRHARQAIERRGKGADL